MKSFGRLGWVRALAIVAVLGLVSAAQAGPPYTVHVYDTNGVKITTEAIKLVVTNSAATPTAVYTNTVSNGVFTGINTTAIPDNRWLTFDFYRGGVKTQTIKGLKGDLPTASQASILHVQVPTMP